MPSARTIEPRRRIFIFYALLALLLASGLLLTGSIPVWRGKAARFAKNVLPALWAKTAGGRYVSSDHLLAELQLNRPSETLIGLMAELAPDETAVFVGPASDQFFTQFFFTFSYLSWPHQIAVLGCETDGASPQVLFKPRAGVKVTRAFFYLQPPPSRLAVESRALGPKLKVIKLAKGEEWTSYCSQ